MSAAGDLEARRRRREAIGTLGEADHYPAQLRDFLDALAPIEIDERELPRKARGLLHLVACPPPDAAPRLERKIGDGRSFIDVLDILIQDTGVELRRRWEMARAIDPLTEVPRADLRRLLLEAVPRL